MSASHRATLYAIFDRVTQEIVGVIQHHRHEATAIRFFADVCSMPDSIVARHLTDHELVQLGHIDEQLQITPEYKVLLTGQQWAAANKQETKE